MTAAAELAIRFGNAGADNSYDPGALELATVLVRSYTRGEGCPDVGAAEDQWPDDLAAVRHLVAHRICGGDLTRTRESAAVEADYSESFFRPFRGFDLLERLVLDRYRRRVM